MTWRGWEEYVPQAQSARIASEPPKSPMNKVRPRKNTNDLPGAQAKRGKYGAVKTTVDGFTFDSRREADRYCALLMEQRAGAIHELELQPQFPLSVTTPNGATVIIGRYIADFRYRRNGALVVEDAKGYTKKELYVWKKKHVEVQYGIAILET